jgi:DNA-binding protein H-NS
MDERTLMEMPLDGLWDLHESIITILASKLETQKSEIEDRLRQLRADAAPEHVLKPSRRPYPAVSPKFRNPAQLDQTWSGRGKRPRWVIELLNAGMSIRDFQISEMSTSPT